MPAPVMMAARQVGRSVTLNGSNKYITFGNVLGKERTDPFTWDVYAYQTVAAGSIIVSKNVTSSTNTGRGIAYGPQADGSVYGALYNDVGAGPGHHTAEVITAAGAAPINKWKRVTLTNDGSGNASGMKLYVNDISQSLTILSSDISGTVQNTEPLIWGAFSSLLQFAFTGKTCQLRMWSKALTQAEITLTGGLSFGVDVTSVGPTSNLTGWWPVTDSDTTSGIADASGGGHTGTPVNLVSGDFAPVRLYELRA